MTAGDYTIEVVGDYAVSDPDTIDSDSVNGRVVFVQAAQLAPHADVRGSAQKSNPPPKSPKPPCRHRLEVAASDVPPASPPPSP